MKIAIKSVVLSLICSVSLHCWAISSEDAQYLPELHSAAWSPELSKEDINKMRFAIYRMAMHMNNQPILDTFKPYIKDKRNVEARYMYALALAYQVRIPEVLSMLKELSLEGYPYAIETYGEKRICKLEKYEDICDEYGFNEVKKRAYLDWVRKDPLVPYMYIAAFQSLPNMGYVTNKRLKISPEGKEILKEGARKGSYLSAQLLFWDLTKIEGKSEGQVKKMKDYRDLANKLLISGDSWNQYTVPFDECYNRAGKVLDSGYKCISHNEQVELLDNLAKKGKLATFDNMAFNYIRNDGDITTTLYQYIRGEYDPSNFPENVKKIYDRAIKLNNGRGWGYHGYKGSIEPWEKEYNDSDSRTFWDKVHKLFD